MEGNLLKDSWIRPNRLFTGHSSLIIYKIGKVKSEKIGESIQKVIELLREEK